MDFRNKADWQKLGASDEWKSTAGPDNANFVDTASVKRYFLEVEVHHDK